MRYRSLFMSAILLLFFITAMPSWAGDSLVQDKGFAVASLDSPGEIAGVTTEDSHPAEVQVTSIDHIFIYAASEIAKEEALLFSGKEEAIVDLAEYARPPDLIKLTGLIRGEFKNSKGYIDNAGIFKKIMGVLRS